MSGLIADARTLVEHARVETQVRFYSCILHSLFYSCIFHSLFITSLFILLYVHTQNHRFSYGEPMTVESTTQAICDLALRFGEGEEESMVSIYCYYH
jgi:20S proteasome alpha/beta subunit